ncbi:MAG TPA: hypothetical protein VKJ01_13715 [Candidatus Solibacter sp.]|nr:hypothetical protein [Candidatus Solibacter sp.]
MERSLLELEAIVRNRICAVCTSRTAEGQCGLDEPSSCALFRLFPEVAAAIRSVNSDDIRVYIEAIRKNVCSVCSEQAVDGSCETRQEVQCALDAYLLPVVEAIEEATAKSFDRKSVAALGAGSVTHLNT